MRCTHANEMLISDPRSFGACRHSIVCFFFLCSNVLHVLFFRFFSFFRLVYPMIGQHVVTLDRDALEREPLWPLMAGRSWCPKCNRQLVVGPKVQFAERRVDDSLKTKGRRQQIETIQRKKPHGNCWNSAFSKPLFVKRSAVNKTGKNI